MFNLSTQNVKSHPEDYLYIFASDEFLNYLDVRSRMIIKQKRANQNKVIALCAKNASVDVSVYTDAIRQGFIDIYGITPAEILVKLASGETVAGKNWSEGVYGVGAITKMVQFTQKTPGGSTVSVGTDGKFYLNGDTTPENGTYDATIYRNGCPNGIGGYTLSDGDGGTYASAYSKTKKMYYASSYTAKSGEKYNPDGSAMGAAFSSDIWESILGFLDKFSQWLLSLFNMDTKNTLANPKNVAPSQVTDGFATEEAGLGTWGLALLASAAVGVMLWGDGLKGKKGK